MYLSTLSAINFRLFSHLSFSFEKNEITYLVGENGQGKTSFLEAIYYLCFFSSFQSIKEEQITRQGTDFFSLFGEFVSDTVSQTVSIQYKDAKKKIEVNNKQITDRSEIIGDYLSVIFKHSDILLIQADPQQRRNFVDQTLCLTSKEYLRHYRDYKRLLRQKNNALKLQQYELVEVLNTQLIESGLPLIEHRKDLLVFLGQGIQEQLPAYLGNTETIELRYEESWTKTPLEQFSAQRTQERRHKTSLVGPHRDRFELYSKGILAKQRLSTGQCRYLALLLRVLQSQYIHREKKRSPIYLFDDVFLELDAKRREYFLSSLPPIEQAVFTFLPEESLPAVKSYAQKTYKVQKGVIT